MYLYILNRPSFQDEIAHMEFYALTGTRVNGNYAVSGTYVHSNLPAYIDSCIEVLFYENSSEGLYRKIKDMNYKKEQYRVRFINTGIHVEFSERKRIERDISDIFEGAPDLKNPDEDFVVTFTGEAWIFGRLKWKAENRWLLFEKKPHTFCNSLPARMSRAVVNIASMNAPGRRFIDPCCGMGTVLIQAADMGYDIHGSDINSIVVQDANTNLVHFGFKPVIVCMDASEISESYDISVADLPYGVLSKRGSDRYEDIIGNLRKICSQSVILSGEDISSIIIGSGFEIVETCLVHKGGLDRHITLCR